MTSWPANTYAAPANAPAGRSRSRSPDRFRGGYPPSRQYSDPTYMAAGTGADYRSDWDYRQREWDNYERERAEWEARRSGRGRSRSPGYDEAGRPKRRRSPSPYERDRYEPRPRYGDDYDTHSRAPPGGYSSPGRRTQYPPQRSGRSIPDPHSLDYPATLKHYSDWFKSTYPDAYTEDEAATREAEKEGLDTRKVGIRARYDKYRKSLSSTQLQILFDHHKKSAWFVEKYDLSPTYVNLRARVRSEGWKGRVDLFISELESGMHDPSADAPASATSGPSPTRETVQPSSDEVKPVDEDIAFGMDADDEAAEGDAKQDTNGKANDANTPTRGADEVAVKPEGNQVMIRTIPPDIGRVKIEELCSTIAGFRYLALGDPLQKRHYYRAGWIRFDDDADMVKVVAEIGEKKIEGFKLHVTHSTKPFFTRIRYTPPLANRPDRLEKDLSQAKRLASILEDEAVGLAKTLESTGDNANGQTELADDMEVDPEIKARGSRAVENRIEKLVSELPPLEDPEDEAAITAQQATKTAIALDLYRAYLRAAFNTCYYCACTTDHLEELTRKCVKHVRRTTDAPAPPEMEGERDRDKERERERAKNKDEQWPELTDSKIAVLINRDGVDPRDYGGKNYEEELAKSVAPHIKQEDESKYRCIPCSKLFRATAFVEKHVANKHAELIKGLEELPYFNNFALDPLRIQPFQHPPQHTGNGQQAPPQAYGLPGHAYVTEPRYGQQQFPPPGYSNGGAGYGSFSAPPPYYRGEPPVRRLSERMGGFASNDIDLPLPTGIEGLPAKPIGVGVETGHRRQRSDRPGRGGSLPPPPDAKEDPRAAAGKKVSYHDMDEVADGGDIELTY